MYLEAPWHPILIWIRIVDKIGRARMWAQRKRHWAKRLEDLLVLYADRATLDCCDGSRARLCASASRAVIGGDGRQLRRNLGHCQAVVGFSTSGDRSDNARLS